MSIYATVIADSIGPRGNRLTTMEIQCHRFVLAEFNTHRDFSRNSASSRAIPFEKQMLRMSELGYAYPLSWPLEQKGMQGGQEHEAERIEAMREEWTKAANTAVVSATKLNQAGLHKSVVNRLLEPFMWHKIIVSSTEWENFFDQRVSVLAQPEIRAVAEQMQKALYQSTPKALHYGEWHLPYIGSEDWDAMFKISELGVSAYPLAVRISAARCARVSYLTHDGKRDIKADLDLYNKLATAEPPHWSPMEHVARPRASHETQLGNFHNWSQLRHYPLKDAA